MLAGSVAVAADYPTTVSGLNPVAYYRFNENVPVTAPDWATNSGSLGLPGYGYYVGSVIHPDTGALVAQPTDMAANFSGGRVMIPYNAALNPAAAFTV